MLPWFQFKYITIGLGNGVTPISHQIITWISVEPDVQLNPTKPMHNKWEFTNEKWIPIPKAFFSMQGIRKYTKWSSEEKKFLVSYVSKNAPSEANEWERCAESLNEVFSNKRTGKFLRGVWMDMLLL